MERTHITFYYFISNFKFGVNFFSIFNSFVSICAPLAEKDTFYQARVEQHGN